MAELTGYCIKCKGKQPILEAKEDKFKNGTPIMKGKCSGCGGPLFRIIRKKKDNK